MASSAQINQVLGLLVGMFQGTPGKQFLADFTGRIDRGTTIDKLAEDLGRSAEFQIFFPVSMSSTDFANGFLTPFGLQNNAIARDFVIARDLQGINRGSIILEGVRALAATTDPQFETAKKIYNDRTAVSSYFTLDRNIDSLSIAELRKVLEGVNGGQFDKGRAITAIDETYPSSGGARIQMQSNTESINPTQADTRLKTTDVSDLLDASTNVNSLNSSDTINGGGGFDRLVSRWEEQDGTVAVNLKPTLTGIESIRFKAVATTAALQTANKVTLDLVNATGVQSLFLGIDNGTHGELLNIEALNTPLTLTGGGDRTGTQISLSYKGNLTGTADRLTADLGENGSTVNVDSFNVASVENATFKLNGGAVTIGNFNDGLATDQQSLNTLRNLTFTGSGNLTLGKTTDANRLSFGGTTVAATASVDAKGLTGDVTINLLDQVSRFAVEAGTGSLKVSNTGSTTTAAPTNSAISVIAGTGTLDASLGASQFIEARGSAGNDTIDISTFTGGDGATPSTPTTNNNGGIVGGVAGLIGNNGSGTGTGTGTGTTITQNAVVSTGAGNDTVKMRAGTVAIDLGAGDDTLEVLDLETAGVLTAADTIFGGDGLDTLASNAANFANLTFRDSNGNLQERITSIERLKSTGTGNIVIDTGAIPRDIRDFQITGDNQGTSLTNLINTDTITFSNFKVNKAADGTLGRLNFAAAAAPATSIGTATITFVGATTLPPNVTTEVDGEQGLTVASNVTFTGFNTINLSSQDGDIDKNTNTAPQHKFLGGTVFNNSTAITATLSGKGGFDFGKVSNNIGVTINGGNLAGSVKADLTSINLDNPFSIVGGLGNDTFRVGAEPRPDVAVVTTTNDRTSIDGGAGGIDKIVIAGNYNPQSDATLEGIEIIEFDRLSNDITQVNLSNQSGESFTVNGTTLTRGAAVAGSTTQFNALQIQLSSGADSITGSRFNDTISGGQGADTIVGGLGNDVFGFNNNFGAADQSNAASTVTRADNSAIPSGEVFKVGDVFTFNRGVDTIRDFTVSSVAGGEMDKLDVANPTQAINNLVGLTAISSGTKGQFVVAYGSFDRITQKFTLAAAFDTQTNNDAMFYAPDDSAGAATFTGIVILEDIQKAITSADLI